MKILFFVGQFPSVSETFVLNQVTSMIDRGHDVCVYSFGKPDASCSHNDVIKYDLLSKTIYMNLEVPRSHVIRFLKIIPYVFRLLISFGITVFRLSFPKYGHPLLSKNLVQYYIAQRLLYLGWTPDVIVSHFGNNGIIVTALRNAGIIPQTTKCFTYFHAHEICRMSLAETARFYAPIFNASDILLPINNLWKNQLIAAGANSHNVKVLHMGVDLQRYRFVERNIIGDTIHILSVGRLCGQKGFEYAIKGVVKYKEMTQKKISFNIIGRGELEDSLKNLVKKLNAFEYIHFLGPQPQQIVSEEMEKSNIFLLPSVTDEKGYMEGIPVALMEAMARGLVCVSTYHSGIPELIKNGECGFLCKEKDSNDIAMALLEIENLSQSQFDQIRNNARCIVEKDFDVVKETKKLQDLFER